MFSNEKALLQITLIPHGTRQPPSVRRPAETRPRVQQWSSVPPVPVRTLVAAAGSLSEVGIRRVCASLPGPPGRAPCHGDFKVRVTHGQAGNLAIEHGRFRGRRAPSPSESDSASDWQPESDPEIPGPHPPASRFGRKTRGSPLEPGFSIGPARGPRFCRTSKRRPT